MDKVIHYDMSQPGCCHPSKAETAWSLLTIIVVMLIIFHAMVCFMANCIEFSMVSFESWD
jgi:hypothetical protein